MNQLDKTKLLKGWVFDFQGTRQQHQWSDSYRLVFKGKRKQIAVSGPGEHRHISQEEALKSALKSAEGWLEQNGLERMLGLAEQVEVQIHLKDFPEAYQRLPFRDQGFNLGDSVRHRPTEEEGTISDAVFAGRLEGPYKITYEVNRGDGLFFWSEGSALDRQELLQGTS